MSRARRSTDRGLTLGEAVVAWKGTFDPPDDGATAVRADPAPPGLAAGAEPAAPATGERARSRAAPRGER
jgi:hypothetical protein